MICTWISRCFSDDWCESRAVCMPPPPVFTIRTDAVIKMSLANMHAPSFEAVNQIATFTSCQVCLSFSFKCILYWVESNARRRLHLLLQTFWDRMVQMRSSVGGMDAPPYKEARKHIEERKHRLIFACHVFFKLYSSLELQSYLLSSPPALTTKRSAFAKRTLVKWAEWPRKRLCLPCKRSHSRHQIFQTTMIMG